MYQRYEKEGRERTYGGVEGGGPMAIGVICKVIEVTGETIVVRMRGRWKADDGIGKARTAT